MVCGKLINTPERNRRKAFLFALDLIRNKRFDYNRGVHAKGAQSAMSEERQLEQEQLSIGWNER